MPFVGESFRNTSSPTAKSKAQYLHNSSTDFEQSTSFVEYHVLYFESVVPNVDRLKIAHQPDPNKVEKYIYARHFVWCQTNTSLVLLL
jgi:hypothetical protein